MNFPLTAESSRKAKWAVPEPPKRRLRDQFADWMRMKNYSRRTIEAYVADVLDFVLFSGKRDPHGLGPDDVGRFLTMLATKRNVTWKTQNQNLCALVLFYDSFLQQPLGDIGKFMAASKPSVLPVVLSRGEIDRIFAVMRSTTKLAAQLQYGCGLRVGELVELRVKDIDFERDVVSVLMAKGGKSRQVPLPDCLRELLREHLARIKIYFDQDGGWLVSLPNAYARKNPSAERSWAWQWLFPSRNLSTDPADGRIKRYHLFAKTIQHAFKLALGVSGITKKATTHSLRHSFATHLLEANVPIYDVQKLLGHSRVETTMIYNHVAVPAEKRIRSPLDRI